MLISKVIRVCGRLYPFNFCNSRSRKILMVGDPRKVKNKYFHGDCKILSNNKCDHLRIDKKTLGRKNMRSVFTKRPMILSCPYHQVLIYFQFSCTRDISCSMLLIRNILFKLAILKLQQKAEPNYHDKVKS